MSRFIRITWMGLVLSLTVTGTMTALAAPGEKADMIGDQPV